MFNVNIEILYILFLLLFKVFRISFFFIKYVVVKFVDLWFNFIDFVFIY